jgi:hypothetical protein
MASTAALAVTFDSATSTAWATWTLVVVAAAAAWYARRVYGIESKRDQDRAALALREQAAKVSAWHDTKALPVMRHPAFGGLATWHGIYILNRSELPVHDVTLTMVPLNDDGEVVPGAEPHGLVVPLVPPTTGDEPAFHKVRPTEAGDPVRFGVDMRFRDAGELVWTRDNDGRLSVTTLAKAITATFAFDAVVDPSTDQS